MFAVRLQLLGGVKCYWQKKKNYLCALICAFTTNTIKNNY